MESGVAFKWAKEVFGDCDLGDLRRTDRLVEIAARQAHMPDSSTLKSCDGDSAAEERCYRFLRSKKFKTGKIDESAFAHTAKKCGDYQVVLAIQDTTTIAVSNTTLREDLIETGCPTGWVVHSSLAVDGGTGCLIGLLDQKRWIRPKIRPGKEVRAERAYKEKESFKWQHSLDASNKRLSDSKNIITICDREADIYEFLLAQQEHGHRYLIRAKTNRKTSSGAKLFEEMEMLPLLGRRVVDIAQRGASLQKDRKQRPARPGRKATLEVRAGEITVLAPRDNCQDSIKITAVLVSEIDAPIGSEPLLWRLLTNEPINSFEDSETIIRYYEKRWLIEEFHKSWKTGCRIEERPLQSLATLDRLYAISAHVAVKLLQMKMLAAADPEASCEMYLSKAEWKCLYVSTSKGQKLPAEPPNMRWAYYAIAKLGGWIDTKHTGRVGWKSMWDGWKRLEERVIGWKMATGE